MTKKRRFLVLAIGILVILCGYYYLQLLRGYTISFYGFPHWSVRANDSSIERGGLRTTITGIRRLGEEVRLAYAFEWVRPNKNDIPVIFMRPFGQLSIEFWDSQGKNIVVTTLDQDGRKMEGTYVPYHLGAFAKNETYLHEDVAEVMSPKEARFVSIRGTTNKVPIPDP